MQSFFFYAQRNRRRKKRAKRGGREPSRSSLKRNSSSSVLPRAQHPIDVQRKRWLLLSVAFISPPPSLPVFQATGLFLLLLRSPSVSPETSCPVPSPQGAFLYQRGMRRSHLVIPLSACHTDTLLIRPWGRRRQEREVVIQGRKGRLGGRVRGARRVSKWSTCSQLPELDFLMRRRGVFNPKTNWSVGNMTLSCVNMFYFKNRRRKHPDSKKFWSISKPFAGA